MRNVKNDPSEKQEKTAKNKQNSHATLNGDSIVRMPVKGLK